MKKSVLMCIIGVLGMSTAAFAADKINMQEGLWEVVSTVTMPGMTLPATTFNQCITGEDLVPKTNQPGQDCSMTDISYKGSTVIWTVKCKTDNGSMVGKGSVTYKGTTYTGDMEMTMSGQQTMQMKTHMEGKRVGDCP